MALAIKWKWLLLWNARVLLVVMIGTLFWNINFFFYSFIFGLQHVFVLLEFIFLSQRMCLTLFKLLQTLSARFNENDCKGCKLRRSRITLLCLKAWACCCLLPGCYDELTSTHFFYFDLAKPFRHGASFWIIFSLT